MPYEIEVDELKRALDAGEDWVLVDVRDGWEHALVHIPGAVHIPLGQLAQRLGELQQERPHVLYCHHGMRSMRAGLGTPGGRGHTRRRQGPQHQPVGLRRRLVRR